MKRLPGRRSALKQPTTTTSELQGLVMVLVLTSTGTSQPQRQQTDWSHDTPCQMVRLSAAAAKPSATEHLLQPLHLHPLIVTRARPRIATTPTQRTKTFSRCRCSCSSSRSAASQGSTSTTLRSRCRTTCPAPSHTRTRSTSMAVSGRQATSKCLEQGANAHSKQCSGQPSGHAAVKAATAGAVENCSD